MENVENAETAENAENVPEENPEELAEETLNENTEKELVNNTVLLRKGKINNNNKSGSSFFSLLFILVLFVSLFILGTNYNAVKDKFLSEYKTGLLSSFNDHKKNDDYAAIVDFQ